MSAELEQFKKKIQGYSIAQLEEIVMSIDKIKYPEKLSVIREVLIAKKLELPLVPEELPQVKEEPSFELLSNTQALPVINSLPPKAEAVPPLDVPVKESLKVKPLKIRENNWMFWLLSGFAALTSVIAVYFIVLPHTQWAGKGLWVRVGSEITGISLTEPLAEKDKENASPEPVSDEEVPSEEGSL